MAWQAMAAAVTSAAIAYLSKSPGNCPAAKRERDKLEDSDTVSAKSVGAHVQLLATHKGCTYVTRKKERGSE